MKKLVFCLGVTSLALASFCFPNFLASRPVPYSKVSQELGVFSLSSQIWLADQDLSLAKIKKQGDNRKELKKIFSRLAELTNEIKKPMDVALKKKFKAKNRNHTYLPYDENRTGREIPGFYLSASDVITHAQHYIVAQAPLKATISDFWHALLVRHCPLIVTTAMPIEFNQDKAYAYWEEEAFPVYTKEWKIEHSNKNKEILGTASKHRLVKRTFYATNRETSEKQTITQLHYENWPDNGIPDMRLFTKLLDATDSMALSKETPITVHCSAGIGRSGTFVAGHSLRKSIRKEKSNEKKLESLTINIPEAVMILRLQRKWMVATSRQLQTIYQLLGDEI